MYKHVNIYLFNITINIYVSRVNTHSVRQALSAAPQLASTGCPIRIHPCSLSSSAVQRKKLLDEDEE